MSAADALAMLRAILAGQDFPPPGIEDTPASRALWQAITADVAAMPKGVIPDIPG